MLKKYLSLIVFISILVLFSSCSSVQSGQVSENTTLPPPETQEKQTDPVINQPVQDNDVKEENIPSATEENSINLEDLENVENSFVAIDAFPHLSFEQPLEFQSSGDGSDRVFIVEKSGRILLTEINSSQQPKLFLNISDRVNDSGGEQGLLGLAFHPDFAQNGNFFLNYTDSNGTVISRFTVEDNNSDTANPDSEEKILTFDQPYSNHNGGKIAFGPEDGYLYISTGDGGGAGDPQGNGQNLKTFLGKLLRIDVDNRQQGLNYSIPADNPFADNNQGYLPEIYAYGLRNPWRFSFDPATGNLWAADVGQNKVEEINIIEKGQNYGWNIMEGSQCFDPPADCNQQGLILPIYEYEHPLGQSITGGYVYRGSELPALYGIYVYADFVTGYIWGLAYHDQQEVKNFTLAETNLNISSFGLGREQELYMTSFDGNVYKLALP